jgi:hypothetical protein
MLHPFAKACLKLSSVETAKDSAECVMRWNTIGKLQKLFEPRLMSQRKPFNISLGIRPADCAAQRQRDHVDQQMILPAIVSRVWQLFEECKKFKVPIGFHD